MIALLAAAGAAAAGGAGVYACRRNRLARELEKKKLDDDPSQANRRGTSALVRAASAPPQSAFSSPPQSGEGPASLLTSPNPRRGVVVGAATSPGRVLGTISGKREQRSPPPNELSESSASNEAAFRKTLQRQRIQGDSVAGASSGLLADFETAAVATSTKGVAAAAKPEVLTVTIAESGDWLKPVSSSGHLSFSAVSASNTTQRPSTFAAPPGQASQVQPHPKQQVQVQVQGQVTLSIPPASLSALPVASSKASAPSTFSSSSFSSSSSSSSSFAPIVLGTDVLRQLQASSSNSSNSSSSGGSAAGAPTAPFSGIRIGNTPPPSEQQPASSSSSTSSFFQPLAPAQAQPQPAYAYQPLFSAQTQTLSSPPPRAYHGGSSNNSSRGVDDPTSLFSPSSAAFAMVTPASPPHQRQPYPQQQAAGPSASTSSLAAALGYEGPPPGAERPRVMHQHMHMQPHPSASAPAPAPSPSLAAALGYLPAERSAGPPPPSMGYGGAAERGERGSRPLTPVVVGAGSSSSADFTPLAHPNPLPLESVLVPGPPQAAAAAAFFRAQQPQQQQQQSRGPALPDFFAKPDDDDGAASGSQTQQRAMMAMAAEQQQRSRQLQAAEEQERQKRLRALPGFFEEPSEAEVKEEQQKRQQQQAMMAERQRQIVMARMQQQQQQQRSSAAPADPFFNSPSSSSAGPNSHRAGAAEADDDEQEAAGNRRRALAALGMPDLPPPSASTTHKHAATATARKQMHPPPSSAAAVPKALRLTDDGSSGEGDGEDESVLAARRTLQMMGIAGPPDSNKARTIAGHQRAPTRTMVQQLALDPSALEPVVLGRPQQQQQQQALEGLGLSLADLGNGNRSLAAAAKRKSAATGAESSSEDEVNGEAQLQPAATARLPWELDASSLEGMDAVEPSSSSSSSSASALDRSASPSAEPPSAALDRSVFGDGSPFLVKSFSSSQSASPPSLSIAGFQERRGRWGGLDINVAALVATVGSALSASATAPTSTPVPSPMKMSRRLRRELVAGISGLSAMRHPHVNLFLGAVLQTDGVTASATPAPAGALPQRRDLLLLVSEQQSAGTLASFLHPPPMPRTASFQGQEYEVPSKQHYAAATPLPWSVIRSLALDIARGMAYLHAQKLTRASSPSSSTPFWHGCLQPSSCLVGDGMRVKITAVSLVPLLASAIRHASHRTLPREACEAQAVAMMLPACYVAPEVLKTLGGFQVATVTSTPSSTPSLIVTQALDVFSYGMALWEVVERRLPFEADRGIPTVVAARILAGERPPLPDPMGPRFVAPPSPAATTTSAGTEGSASVSAGTPLSSSPAASEGKGSVPPEPAPATAASDNTKGLATRKAFLALMQKCWAQDPLERPTFARIVSELEKMALY